MIDRKGLQKRRFVMETDERLSLPYKRRIQMLNQALETELAKNAELNLKIDHYSQELMIKNNLNDSLMSELHSKNESIFFKELEIHHLTQKSEYQNTPRWCLKRLWQIFKS